MIRISFFLALLAVAAADAIVPFCATGGWYVLDGDDPYGDSCKTCPKGYGCAPKYGIILEKNLNVAICQPGYYQPLEGQSYCLQCPRDTKCPGVGSIQFVPCNTTAGQSAEPGSAACYPCPNLEMFLNGTSCKPKTVCKKGLQYENVTSEVFAGDRVCRDVTPFEVVLYRDKYPPEDPWCVRGSVQALRCTDVLVEYVVSYSTPFSDLVKIAWQPCEENHYVFEFPVADSEGFLVSPQICKQYTICRGPTKYMVSSGKSTEDQDNVCATATQCSPDTEYMVSDLVWGDNIVGKDRVCATRTVCDPNYHYLARLGNATQDDLCLPRTDCFLMGQGRWYQKYSSVDAGPLVREGRDAVCANYTRCPPGSFANFTGDRTNDRQCTPCLVGTYGVDGDSCNYCPAGTFADQMGSTSCKPCSNCSTLYPSNSSGADEWSACAQGSASCIPAFRTTCTPFSDALCMTCSLPSWSFNPTSRLCEPCAAGFHYASDNHSDVRGKSLKTSQRCIPCTANFYCPGKDTIEACQGLMILEEEDNSHDVFFSVVPSSPPASSFPSDCICNARGGFEGTADGIVGCQPCRDGYYSSPGSSTTKCSPCPVGSYSSRTLLVDRFLCPTAASLSMVKFANQSSGYGGWFWPLQNHSDCTTPVGAASCTQCPADRRKTKQVGSTSELACTRCGDEEFWDGEQQQCRPCTRCSTTYYEILACTDELDRVCRPCTQSVCGTDEFFSGCTPENPRGCSPCTNAPENALYVEGESGTTICAWRCTSGFFLDHASNVCTACTVFNGSTCPAGNVLSSCTHSRDASCDMRCDERTKPFLHSEWVKSSYFGGILKRDKNPSLPNEGCLWECAMNYVRIVTDSGLVFCVLEEKSDTASTGSAS